MEGIISIDLPKRSEIKSLIKRNIFSLESTPQTKYVSKKLFELGKLDVVSICTHEYNTDSALAYYLKQYSHWSSDSFVETSHKEKFKRCSMENNPHLGIMPVLRLDSETLDYFLKISYIKDGRKTVRYSSYKTGYIDESESKQLENEYITGNMAHIKRNNKDSKKDNKQEFIYKGNKYLRCVNENKVIWFLVEPLEWFIDEKNSMLVCTRIIDCLDGRMPAKCLNELAERVFLDMGKTCIEELLLTPNEEKNNLPFEGRTPRISPNLDKVLRGEPRCTQFVGNFRHYEDYITPITVIEYKYIKDKCTVVDENDDYLTVYFGEYPQNNMDKGYEEIKILEEKLTNKKYTVCHLTFENGTVLDEYPEYEYKGVKYIKIFSAYQSEPILVKVEPVKWYVDKKTNLAIASSSLISIRSYDQIKKLVAKELINSNDINNFLRKFFAKEIIPSKPEYKIEKKDTSNNVISQIIIKKYNIIGEKAKVERIKKLIEDNVFLQFLMEKHNLQYSDFELDNEGKLIIKGLKLF